MLANVGIERAVLANICKGGKNALIEIEDVGVTVNSFTEISNQAIFTSLKTILENNENVDQTILLITLNNLGYGTLFDKKKDIEYIAALFSFPFNENNVRSFAIRLEKLSIARTAILKHREAIEKLEVINGTENIEEIIQISENPIFDLVLELNRDKERGPHLISDKVDEVIQFLKENQSENIGIPTPWKSYNAAIGTGLRRGGVNLIASRVKIGKSTLGKEIILHLSNLKIPSLLLDTEMSLQDQLVRSLASMSNVCLNDIESGKFFNNHIQNQNMEQAIEKLKTNKSFWYESVAGKPFDEILSIIRRWIVKCVGYNDSGRVNNCVVVYDYFKLMDRTQLDNLQEYQAMGFQISRLTDFCKEYDFPCLAFVQLNRQNDISQSDRLRWLCHSYSAFSKKDPVEITDDGPAAGNRKLTVLDTRFGPGLDDRDYICMNFNRNINKIEEVGLKSKLKDNKDDGTFKENTGKITESSEQKVENNKEELELDHD